MSAGFIAPFLRSHVHADDGAAIVLNGHRIGQPAIQATPANFQAPPEGFSVAHPNLFEVGKNILELEVFDFGVASGLNYCARATAIPDDPNADDGILDPSDNCPFTTNPDQQDNDGNGEGDACNADYNDDGLPDGADNCSLIVNPA